MADVRLIDANALKRLIKSGDDLIFDHATECEILHMIDYQETIDAQPVKHGKWIPIDEYCAKCSVCGWWQKTNGKCCTGDANIHRVAYKYCTACGAKMDGDADEQ